MKILRPYKNNHIAGRFDFDDWYKTVPLNFTQAMYFKLITGENSLLDRVYLRRNHKLARSIIEMFTYIEGEL